VRETEGEGKENEAEMMNGRDTLFHPAYCRHYPSPCLFPCPSLPLCPGYELYLTPTGEEGYDNELPLPRGITNTVRIER